MLFLRWPTSEAPVQQLGDRSNFLLLQKAFGQLNDDNGNKEKLGWRAKAFFQCSFPPGTDRSWLSFEEFHTLLTIGCFMLYSINVLAWSVSGRRKSDYHVSFPLQASGSAAQLAASWFGDRAADIILSPQDR